MNGTLKVQVKNTQKTTQSSDSDQAIVSTVHVPIGLIYQMLQPPPGVVEH